jgi:hypothetical protein
MTSLDGLGRLTCPAQAREAMDALERLILRDVLGAAGRPETIGQGEDVVLAVPGSSEPPD